MLQSIPWQIRPEPSNIYFRRKIALHLIATHPTCKRRQPTRRKIYTQAPVTPIGTVQTRGFTKKYIHYRIKQSPEHGWDWSREYRNTTRRQSRQHKAGRRFQPGTYRATNERYTPKKNWNRTRVPNLSNHLTSSEKNSDEPHGPMEWMHSRRRVGKASREYTKALHQTALEEQN